MSVPVLLLRGLGIQFGGLKAVDALDLEIASGELIGLIGPNNLKGLGHQNRDLMKSLPITEWLTPESLATAAEFLSVRQARRIDGFLRRVDVR